ncbi:hypothetical protein ACOJBK_41210, partial [Rhizobium beringeri]
QQQKAGTVIAAASACGWATQAILSKIDSEIPAAQRAIDNAQRNNVPNYKEIVDDKTKVNNAFLGHREELPRYRARLEQGGESDEAIPQKRLQGRHAVHTLRRPRSSQSLRKPRLSRRYLPSTMTARRCPPTSRNWVTT